ncbi:MAG: ABC transporter permease, partial [Anaerolineales bacterium]|nr:ABC transporter permease [Anaerolineales bacterium]
MRNKMFLGGIGIVLLFSMIALLAPVIAPTPPEKFVGGANIAPSAEFWFGTTALGKDVFSQTVWGARNSL